MEIDELQQNRPGPSSTDFISLLPNIKKENLDESAVSTAAGTSAQSITGKSSNSAGNPCDSVEKPVDQTSSTPNEVTPTKCIYCSQMLAANDHPKLMECLHVACAQCVQTKFRELDRTMPNMIHCPVCNSASQSDFIIDNQFLIEQNLGSSEDGPSDSEKGNSATVKCSSCNDDASATSWCVDCTEFICDNCVQAHQRLKITKDHTIKPKEEATTAESQTNSQTNKSLMCAVHSQEKLTLFCETCDKLTCRDCQLTDHRDHKYKFAHEIATETRNVLTSLLSDINYKRFLLTSAKKVIDDRQNLITERKKDMIKEITQMVVKITNTVNSRGKQLAMRVNEVCDAKLKVLNEKKDALQLLSDNTDHCIDFVSNALEKGSDCAILYSKKLLGRHLQKLKCQRADIPNPEIPVRLNIQLNQVNELQKVITQMGTILVDGKPYPATPQLNGPPRQPPSPTMAPPMRPGLQPPGMQQISPNHPNAGPPFGPPQNGPPMYNNSSPHNQQFNMQSMNRQFTNDGHVRYPGMGPVGMQRQPVPHVSSSTHPQNMDISLRGLLNTQSGQAQPQGNHLGFNSPPNYTVGHPGPLAQNGPSPPHMRPHFTPPQPSPQNPNSCQNFQQNPIGPNGPATGFMNNAPPRFPQQPATAQQQQQQNFQRMNQQMNSGQPGPPGMRPMMQNNMGFPGNPSFNQPNLNQMGMQMSSSSNHSVAKWHIPQSAQGNGASLQGPLMQFPNGRQGENFKISLKSPNTLKNTTPPVNGSSSNNQSPNVHPNVTSTNPKTPSPSTNDASKDFTEPIDKVRDDSINDLMATIAKLDSNGVQVLPEGGRNKTTSPQVHSSTDLSNTQEDDPNEDWCAVCLDGGELMCCDKCPKVFHQNCHLPTISSLPDESETWQCLLCVNLATLCANIESERSRIAANQLTPSELKIIQRICLELYCQYEQSLPFREPEAATNSSYYEIICNPMSLDVIRTRLDPSSPNHYKDIASFVHDIRLIFKNCYLYHQEDSRIFNHARYLESFFEEQLAKWLPKYTANSMISPSNGTNNNNIETILMNNGSGNNNTSAGNCGDGQPPSKRMKSVDE